MAPKKKEDLQSVVLLGRPRGTLKMGLVGLPNVGKSTTFNILSNQSVPAENYPFCTLDPNEARVAVHDPRFKNLVQIFKPKSEILPMLSIVDIAGLVPGAHKGEGLGNAFLSHIQHVDGIFHVVRAFDNDEVTHTDGSVDPIRDLTTISEELRLKDLERSHKTYEDLKKTLERGQDKSRKTQYEFAAAVFEHLNSGKWISANKNWTLKQIDYLNEQCFLTAKPVVYLINLSENDFLRKKNKYLAKIHAWIQENNEGIIIPYSAEYETKLLNNSENQTEPLSAIDKIIHAGYDALHLLHYFTCGADEVKCWTFREGTKAPQAAGLIHSDMENGFICADVTKYDDLISLGSEAQAKSAGRVATRGKDYVVQDGDIIIFKFNPSGGKK